MIDFKNKVAVVTGASSGIGEAVARELAGRGAKVALLARRVEALKKIEKELKKAGYTTKAYRCDVHSQAELTRTMKRIKTDFKKIDIVMANAGFGVAADFQKLTIEDYRRQFETNVFGVLRTIYACLADLKTTQGQIVLLGSIAGHIGIPGGSAYSMSKFAIRALAESLLIELAPFGIGVTLISPGFVASQIHKVNNKGIYRPDAEEGIPSWLLMPTSRAAKQIVRAIQKRKPEEIITSHGKILFLAHQYFPATFRKVALLSGGRKRPKAPTSQKRHAR